MYVSHGTVRNKRRESALKYLTVLTIALTGCSAQEPRKPAQSDTPDSITAPVVDASGKVVIWDKTDQYWFMDNQRVQLSRVLKSDEIAQVGDKGWFDQSTARATACDDSLPVLLNDGRVLIVGWVDSMMLVDDGKGQPVLKRVHADQ